MVAYQDFFALSQSGDSEERGQAAHLAALAFLRHSGPAEERAALYAALIGFLDDPSVKVRAALAYGLLHAADAPRPILLALLQDSAVISRAVAQYSPALLDADLIAMTRTGELAMLTAIAVRETISVRVAEALLASNERSIILKVLGRAEIDLRADVLLDIAARLGGDPAIRGALLQRRDLPPAARLDLVQAAAEAMAGIRIVKGAVEPRRLDRILRDGTDTAVTSIGERTAADGKGGEFAALLIAAERVSTRLMLHAVANGHVLFFADCLAALSDIPREKVFTILETGSRPALNALLARCGLSEAVRNLVARLIFHARSADLADDVTARHFVITALTEELIVDHDGIIPPELEDAFSYLSEQNVLLARRAARGVMSAFAEVEQRGAAPMPLPEDLGAGEPDAILLAAAPVDEDAEPEGPENVPAFESIAEDEADLAEAERDTADDAGEGAEATDESELAGEPEEDVPPLEELLHTVEGAVAALVAEAAALTPEALAEDVEDAEVVDEDAEDADFEDVDGEGEIDEDEADEDDVSDESEDDDAVATLDEDAANDDGDADAPVSLPAA